VVISGEAREKLLGERIVVIGGDIDDELAKNVSGDLLLLEAEDGERDITCYVNTPGGPVTAGMAIYDTMQLVSCKVVTVAMGLAAGMGLFLLAAGTKGGRYALPHARLALKPLVANEPSSPGDQLIRLEMVEKWRRELITIIAEHTGQTFEQVKSDSAAERWFTAQEGRDYGFIDRVIDNARQTKSRREMRERP
jgi:ATP-dependent Clp protease protease subunit